mmetsp:Transcript_31083/g.69022  ORF Transcript_31083/g.69022 Transcript_31083/m.69022 type:complete len:304 (+) Transcript_31083:149-1060(+)
MSLIVRAFEHGGAVTLIEQALSNAPGAVAPGTHVAVGDVIDVDEQDGFLRGHGTHVVEGKLVANVCGVVERVNKLVFVRPLKSRYTAEQGDVVIGRISEIAGKRWKVDLNSRQEAGLLLSAVNLPGGIQRRRNAEDELNMRGFFKEGDVISAEVQQVMSDGSIALHTRSFKYGKLAGGQLIIVPANLVKRQKQHFYTMEAIGVDLILGCNGLLWVAPHFKKPEDGTTPIEVPQFTLQQIQAATRAANAIRALAKLYLAIYPATIMDAYEIAVESGTPIKDMLETDFLVKVVKSEGVRRHNAAQ